MKELTSRQQEILDFLSRYFKDNTCWPSIRDIQDEFGFKSTNAVMGHLRALEQKGVLIRTPGQARTYQLVLSEPMEIEEPDFGNTISIPIYGSIAAGYPDHVEGGGAIGSLQIDVSSAGIRDRKKTFALKVRGESMIDAGIYDGDVVVVEVDQPTNRSIVAALIDGECTLKRFIQEPGCAPYLRAENANYPDLYPVAELIIQGVARSIVRCL